MNQPWQITTRRLIIAAAQPTTEQVAFLYRLWTDGRVMAMVGLPHGLKTTPEEITAQLSKAFPDEYNRVLIVSLRETGELIGQGKLGYPDNDHIATTDIKLF